MSDPFSAEAIRRRSARFALALQLDAQLKRAYALIQWSRLLREEARALGRAAFELSVEATIRRNASLGSRPRVRS